MALISLRTFLAPLDPGFELTFLMLNPFPYIFKPIDRDENNGINRIENYGMNSIGNNGNQSIIEQSRIINHWMNE